MAVTQALRNGINVLTLARAPVNSFNWELRRDLLAALKTSIADNSVGAIVITGGTRTFSAGADIREFSAGLAGDMMKSPTLPDLVNAIERSPKPVVAAISGSCLGGGLEVALGCHSRVTTADARLALPEIGRASCRERV